MAVKGKLAFWNKEREGGALLSGNAAAAAPIWGYLLYLGLGLVMGLARCFGSCGPFGIAMVAQAGGGLPGIFCLAGASTGYLLTGGLQWGIRYVATATLVYTATFVFQSLKISRSTWFIPLITALITATTSFLNAFELERSISAVIAMVTEVTLAGGCTYLYRQALSSVQRNTDLSEFRYGMGVIVLFATLLMAVAPVEIGAISVGRLMSLLLVMAISCRSRMLAGCAAGITLGLAMDLTGSTVPRYLVCYAFSGLFAGLFAKRGRFIFTLAFTLCGALSVLWSNPEQVPVDMLLENFAAAVIFMILPSGLLQMAGLLSPSTVGKGETGLRVYAARRVENIGDAFRDLHDTIQQSLQESTNDNDAAKVFDRAADTVCIRCRNKNSCWHQDYMDTVSIMNDVTPVMLEKGCLKWEDMPQRFLEKCPESRDFLNAVNQELRALLYRRQYRSRLAEHRTAAFGQYADLSRILEDVAGELRSASGADPLAERRLLRFLNALDIDCDVSVFRDRSGRLRATLESGQLVELIKDGEYLNKLSGVLGVRLCQPNVEEVVQNGRMTLLQAEPLAVSVGIAAMKKKGESCSGDRGTYFKTDQGVLCVILSDGMGSGEEAARESVATVRILERFLKAGVEPGTAMKVLNSVMLLKNSEEWGFATVDLLCVDLFTGESCFYKYGAAPSYVRNGKNIRKIKGRSLAVGLCGGEGAMPDLLRMQLRPGSLAIIASDGVLIQDDDTWLRELLLQWEGEETRELAREALQGAVKQYGCVDDMTVLAVRIENRG